MKSIAGLQDTFTLSLVKGAAKRVRPKVPAAGEAWQGGEVASHEVNRAPGTLCHAGKKELLTHTLYILFVQLRALIIITIPSL